jgi:lipopolysaccharide/colanic/teichoic acid biosynthesis glycosyltransferase
MRAGAVGRGHRGSAQRKVDRRMLSEEPAEEPAAVQQESRLSEALRGIGVGPGDEIVLPAACSVATAEAVAAVGAIPRFADVAPDTLTMSAETVDAAVTLRTVAVIAVCESGQPAAMGALEGLCARRGIALIDAAARTHGATWRDPRFDGLGDIDGSSLSPRSKYDEGCAVACTPPDRLRVAHRQEGSALVIKRALDLTVGGTLLLLTSPLLLVIALAVRLDSPGPVLFRQTRIGRHGQPFEIYKLRSMFADADESLHERYVTQLLRDRPDRAAGSDPVTSRRRAPAYKLEADPRITRVGRLLRALSLDELPQLFNVLKGEMSLVGPRPDLPYATALYGPWQRRRFQVLPGMTGLWQVSGRGELAPADMLRLDVEYVDRWSLWLDLRILLLTAPAVLRKVGSS